MKCKRHLKKQCGHLQCFIVSLSMKTFDSIHFELLKVPVNSISHQQSRVYLSVPFASTDTSSYPLLLVAWPFKNASISLHRVMPSQHARQEKGEKLCVEVSTLHAKIPAYWTSAMDLVRIAYMHKIHVRNQSILVISHFISSMPRLETLWIDMDVPSHDGIHHQMYYFWMKHDQSNEKWRFLSQYF